MIAYLEADNPYTEARMAHTAELQERLCGEIRSRIQDGYAAPYRLRDYHCRRFEEGKDYADLRAQRGSLDATEQIMLDANRLAEGKRFVAVQGMQVSAGQDILAFATDTIGRRIAEPVPVALTERSPNLCTTPNLAVTFHSCRRYE